MPADRRRDRSGRPPRPRDQTTELTALDLQQSEMVRDVARRYGTRIHTDAFGGMIRLAHEKDPNALLGPDVHFQHGFGLSLDEVAILARTGTAVTHGPGVVVGALRGRCPVVELMDAGVPGRGDHRRLRADVLLRPLRGNATGSDADPVAAS